jgi:AcrR family transcriptional regulator
VEKIDDNTRRGRPRGFDETAVLESALQLFWRQGFSGTSYSDLTQATGLNKPSLYAAFGDKEALFAATLDRYDQGPQARLTMDFAECSGFHAGLSALLNGYAELYTSGDIPCGCMVTSALSEARGPDFSPGLREKLQLMSSRGRSRIEGRISRAAAEGELPPGADVEGLTVFVMTFGLGLATAARAGAGLPALQAAIAVAMEAVPQVARA